MKYPILSMIQLRHSGENAILTHGRHCEFVRVIFLGRGVGGEWVRSEHHISSTSASTYDADQKQKYFLCVLRVSYAIINKKTNHIEIHSLIKERKHVFFFGLDMRTELFYIALRVRFPHDGLRCELNMLYEILFHIFHMT